MQVATSLAEPILTQLMSAMLQTLAPALWDLPRMAVLFCCLSIQTPSLCSPLLLLSR